MDFREAIKVKKEKTLIVVTMIILALMIAAVLAVTVRYARADPALTRLEWRTHPPDYAAIGGDTNDR